MARKEHPTLAEPPPDPFQERHRSALHECIQLMGGRFRFETDSPGLLRLVRLAYARLPPHGFPGAAPHCLVRLVLASTKRGRSALLTDREPPRVRPMAGGGILCGVMDGANFVALDPQRRSALIVVSRDMLRFPYHIRYEILEFAVYVLEIGRASCRERVYI